MQVRGIQTSNSLPGLRQDPKLKEAREKAALSLYAEHPSEEITLDEFESYALDRLQLLRGLDAARTREGGSTENPKELDNKYKALCAKHIPLRLEDAYFKSDLRKDVISHFILRLAYSQTEDLRRWFIAQECHLLKYRVEQLSEANRANFMVANGIEYDQLDGEEKATRRDKLVGLTGVVETNFSSTIFYKVPFQQVDPEQPTTQQPLNVNPPYQTHRH